MAVAAQEDIFNSIIKRHWQNSSRIVRGRNDDNNSNVNTIDATRDCIKSNNDLFNVTYYANGKQTSDDDFFISRPTSIE